MLRYGLALSFLFEQAVKNRGLERSLKQAIPQEGYERLEKEMDEIG